MAYRFYEPKGLAKLYALYRPQSSDIVKERIMDFMKKHRCSFKTILDVGCGSGQSLRGWTDTFKECIGVDISKEQIKQGRELFKDEGIQNVSFRVAAAESLPPDVQSCNLVTLGMAWHWVDANAFYKEADRVLTQPGVLAAYSYSPPYFVDNKQATDVIDRFFYNTLKDHLCPQVRQHLEDKFTHVHLPYEISERHNFDYEWCVPLSQVVGLLESASPCWRYQVDHPESEVLSEFKTALKAALSVEQDDAIVKCMLPTYMFISLKK